MKRMQLVILLLAAMTLFLSYRQSHRQNHTEGITRAQTARMLAWTACDMNKNSSKSAEPLIDVDSRLWYADEISVVLDNGLMTKDGDMFYPNHCLTWQEASDIGDFLGIRLSIPLFQKKHPIPLEKWLHYFDEWLSGQNMAITQQLKIEALPSTSEGLDSWQVQTDTGLYVCEGLPLEKYLGQTVTAYISGQQLLMVSPTDARHPEVITASDAILTESDSSDEITKDGEKSTSSKAAEDGETNSGSIEQTEAAPDIRVCIMNDTFTSEEHRQISITSDAVLNLIKGS